MFCCICFFIIFSLLEYLRSFVEASANFRCKHFRNFFESHFSLFMFLSLSFFIFLFCFCVFRFVCECECECEWVCLQWRLKQWESLWGRWTVVGLRIWWWDLGRLIFFFFFFFEVWGNLIQRFIMIRHVGVTGVVWLCVGEDRVVLCVCFLYWFG